MSWDKQCYNMSQILQTVEILKKTKTEYNLSVLGEVVNMGNAMLYGDEFEENIKLYKLDFQDEIWLDKMIRTCDCDSDDYVQTYKFKKGEEPHEWWLEEYTDYEGFVDAVQFENKVRIK